MNVHDHPQKAPARTGDGRQEMRKIGGHAVVLGASQAHQEETAMYLTKKTTMVTRRIVLLAASLIAAAGIAAAAAPGAAAPHPHSAVALPPSQPPGSGDVA
jgi:hypothetical protein